MLSNINDRDDVDDIIELFDITRNIEITLAQSKCEGEILQIMPQSVKQELLDSMDMASGGSNGAFGVVTTGLQASVLAGPPLPAETQCSMATEATRGDTQARDMREKEM